MKKRRAKKILATLLFFLGFLLAALGGLFDRPDIIHLPSPGDLIIPYEGGHAFGSKDFMIVGINLFFYGSIVYGAVSLVFWTVERILNRGGKNLQSSR